MAPPASQLRERLVEASAKLQTLIDTQAEATVPEPSRGVWDGLNAVETFIKDAETVVSGDTNKRTLSCEYRIEQELRDRLERIDLDLRWADAWSKTKRDDRYEAARERLEDVLSVSRVGTTVTVQLSWGGPSDEFVFECDETEYRSLEVDRVTYWFKDWFDGASRRLDSDDEAIAKRWFDQCFAELAVSA